MDINVNSSKSHIDGTGEPGLVSVIIPTYNRAKLLREAIESVLMQSYRCIEVLVVDDGSTDNTKLVVEGFDHRVRYLYQQNSGVSIARNYGLREACGEFIALLDSDDKWLPWKIATQVELMRKFPDIGMIWTDMMQVDASGTVVSQTFLRKMYSAHQKVRIEDICELVGKLGELSNNAPPEFADRPFYRGEIFSQMILGNLAHTPTVLVRRSRAIQVGGFDESLIRSGGDYEFHLATTYFGPVGFIDASSILYRFGAEDQLTGRRNMLNTSRNNLATIRKWLARGSEKITLPKSVIRRHLADAHEWLGGEKYQAGDYWGARSEHLRSIRLRPWQPRLCAITVYYFMPSFIRQFAKKILKKLTPKSVEHK